MLLGNVTHVFKLGDERLRGRGTLGGVCPPSIHTCYTLPLSLPLTDLSHSVSVVMDLGGTVVIGQW